MIISLARIIMLTWFALALIAWTVDIDSNQINLAKIFTPPSLNSFYGLFGYDELGRSLVLRLIDGAGISLFVALSTVTLSAVIGTFIGALAGYIGGRTDRAISRVIDIFLAFPGLLLAIALAGMLGPGLSNVVIALSIMGWVGYARLMRNQVLSIRNRDHVSSALALGRDGLSIIRLHVIPLALAPVWIEVSYGIAGAIIAEAGLSFLGLGVQPPQASWGNMIREGVRYLLVAPHAVLAPGIALSLVVLSANVLGDAMRDKLDVKF
jgi:peptide/nickel transport system permease protein